MRFIGSSGAPNRPVSNDAVTFKSSMNNVTPLEIGLLANGHGFHGDRKVIGPNRCGSAPPSIQGSLTASADLADQQKSSLNGNFEKLTLAVDSESEEQLRFHPAYLSYYCSNVNLNPRLPPPLISQENRRLVHHIGGFMDNWRMPSFDDNSEGSLSMSSTALSTHKEEPEEERSPRVEFNCGAEKNTRFLSQQFRSPLQGHHKTVMDTMQEDFPRTLSPLYSDISHPLGNILTEQAAGSQGLIHMSHGSSLKTGCPEMETAIVGGRTHTRKPFVHSVGLVPDSGVTPQPVLCSTLSDRVVSPHPGLKGMLNSSDAIVGLGVSIDAVAQSDIGRNDSRTTNLKSTDLQRNQHAHPYTQQGTSYPQGTLPQFPIGHSQAQEVHHSSNVKDYFSHGQLKLSESTGITPPMYATAAMYGPACLSLLQPSNLIPPPFNVGGYAVNTSIMPPLITGYAQHNAILDNYARTNCNVRSFAVATGSNITPGVDLQHIYKFYGEHGVIQPSFPDSFYIPYFPHPSVCEYAVAAPFDPLLSGGSPIGSPQGNYDLQRGPSPVTYTYEQRPHVLGDRGINTSNVRREGTMSSNYYGGLENMGVMQYSTSPLPSPVFQESTGARTSFYGKKTENTKLPVSSHRSAGACFGWQGKRRPGKVDESKSHSFPEELKSSRGHRLELSDITGRVVEFSSDQHGSRFIQQKLESCSTKEKASIFDEVLPHASTLMTDVFGNYVIQKFFEHGNPEQRKELANQLTGRMSSFSLQMYGCRVIQKALEVIELGQKTQLVNELDGHVMQCVRDQHGNHVIQKCIECVPADRIGFIISTFHGQVVTLSRHPYGCRVIQSVLEYCVDELQSQYIVDEILQSVSSLAQDPYGNYVTQHVLERVKSYERTQIINKLSGQVVYMSQHKYASNVIEKCLELGDCAERGILIEEIIGQTEGNDNLLIMMKDQFANYVIQTILETCTDKQRKILLDRIRTHLQSLKKYTFGKHIVARVQQLCEESCVGEA